MNEWIAIVLAAAGVFFNLAGCIGLVRLPDVYNRLQAATKCVTLGTCMILAAVAVHGAGFAAGVQAILCILFILVTSPTAAHAIARGAHRSGIALWDKSVCDHYRDDIDGARELPMSTPARGGAQT
jgi:multicomponent Na+:H+ antiporter subunit G